MKEKLPLIVGLGLPILLIVYIGFTFYLSALFVKPGYDFIYTTDNYNDYELKVIDGEVELNSYYDSYSKSYYERTRNIPTIYYYDSDKNTSRSISLSEAQEFTLDSSPTSPDGYKIEQGDRSSIFWDSGYYNTYYIKGHGFSKKIDVEVKSYNFKFLGWVINE